jgi:hypothetical protein
MRAATTRVVLAASVLLALAACSRSNPGPEAGTAATAPAAAPAPAPAPAVAPAAPPPPVDLSGVWQAGGKSDVLAMKDGARPPFTDAGAKLYAQHRAALANGDRSWDNTLRCWPPGTPRIMTIAQPFEISAEPNLVAFTFQYQRMVRFIYVGDAYPTNTDATFMGESHGRWEARALIVHTGNFKAGMTLDSTGLPQSPKLQVDERFELTAPDTLVDHVTITDEEMYSQPWSADITLKKKTGVQVGEDVCVERLRIHP